MAAAAKRFAIRSTIEMELGMDEAYPRFWNFTAWRATTPAVLLDQTAADRELARLKASLRHDHTLVIFDVVTYLEGCKVMGAVRKALTQLRLPNYDDLTREERKSPEVRAILAEISEKARAAAIGAGYSFT
ncbi:hypothetical protein [Pseudomonas sp.]|uniref:hypothetical protein n=1 Tax=Pseudomonas sp. TaxID=306 RepID=UPI00290C5386|nr:hypothetical protein [Pseudomonas sp.]MDU4254503.1 hypothetical protein [Pseudomonas sp.]